MLAFVIRIGSVFDLIKQAVDLSSVGGWCLRADTCDLFYLQYVWWASMGNVFGVIL